MSMGVGVKIGLTVGGIAAAGVAVGGGNIAGDAVQSGLGRTSGAILGAVGTVAAAGIGHRVGGPLGAVLAGAAAVALFAGGALAQHGAGGASDGPRLLAPGPDGRSFSERTGIGQGLRVPEREFVPDNPAL